jgi:hypothetical protein
LGLTYGDLQLLPPPACVPDGKWLARVGQEKITLMLTRQPEHANVNGVPVPQLVASASCVIEGGLDPDPNRVSDQVIHRLKIMLNKITDWVEFANAISKAVHMDVQLEEIEVE